MSFWHFYKTVTHVQWHFVSVNENVFLHKVQTFVEEFCCKRRKEKNQNKNNYISSESSRLFYTELLNIEEILECFI